ncbi:MAG: PAS domain S-box protein [Ignavibacteria bacterium]|nr:PAS domain S-box protein [Ignavibacteria bacterium]
MIEFPSAQKDRFRDLIEGLNIITYEFDLSENRYIYVSRMAESILGYSYNSWFTIGFWYDHLHPDDRMWASEFGRYHTKQHKAHEYEYRMIASDGSVKWLKDIATVNLKNGEPECLQGVLIDMTQRKQTEFELMQNKEMYKTLVEQQSEMITRWRPDGTFTYVNDVYCRFFEKDKRELIGKTYIPQMPPDDLDRFTAFFKQLTKDKPVGTFVHRVILPDGEIRWLKWTDKALFDDSGEIVEYQTVGRDITVQKRAEIALMESEKQLQLIFDNAPIGMALTDFENNYIKVNKAYCEIVGYTKEELMTMTFEEISHPEDKKLDEEITAKAKLGHVTNFNFEKRYIHKNGSTVLTELHLNVLKNNTGSPHQIIAQVVDITKRKESEHILKQTQARLSAILNNLLIVTIYEYGEDINFVSENILDILGYSSDEFMNNKDLFSNLMLKEDIIKYDRRVDEWKKNGSAGVLSNEIRVRNRKDEIVWLEDHMFEVKPENGKTYFSGIMIDITQQKKTKQKIHDTETKFAAVLKNLPKVVVYQSGEGRDFVSENIAEMIGYQPGDIISEKYFFGKIMHPDDLVNVKSSLQNWHKVNEEGIQIMEFRLEKKSGGYVWIEDHMFKVKADDGQEYLSGVLIDVTERKLYEQKISQSLKEKELLLKEIHHRVKNNLQVVSSLLKLQSGYVSDSHTLDILTDSQNRVKSMALVHQKLYQSKDYSKIDFSEYLKQLSVHLLNSFRTTSNSVELNVSSDNVFLSIDLAIPCGLIINELISNSLKYAFPVERKGIINVGVNSFNNNEYHITVQDNGIGFPKDINYRDTKSLGLQLVNTLVGQIDGTISMDNHVGTSFKIGFSSKENSKLN